MIYKQMMTLIYESPADFISWPARSLLLWPGRAREDYHRYPDNVRQQLRNAGISPDGRSNGPAICSFFLAGGIRPLRETGKGWSIHHIYDGNFPFPNKMSTTHAIKDGRYFTEAAGLVAVHPLADAMAEEFADFAWWLRREAYKKFGFDPDNVLHQAEAAQKLPESKLYSPNY